MPIITVVPLRRTPPSWELARARAPAFLNERYFSRTSSPTPVEFSKPATTFTIYPTVPTPALVPPIPSIEGSRPESPIHSFPAILSTVPSATVAATLLFAAVPVILLGMLTSLSSTLAPPSLPPVSSAVLSSVSIVVPALTIGSSEIFLSPASVVLLPQPCLPPAAPSSVQPLVVPESALLSTPPRAAVLALLRESLVHRDAEFAKLDESFLTFEDRVLELKSSSAKTTSGRAHLRSQVGALQTDVAAMRAYLTASQTSVAMATFEFDRIRAAIVILPLRFWTRFLQQTVCDFSFQTRRLLFLRLLSKLYVVNVTVIWVFCDL